MRFANIGGAVWAPEWSIEGEGVTIGTDRPNSIQSGEEFDLIISFGERPWDEPRNVVLQFVDSGANQHTKRYVLRSDNDRSALEEVRTFE